MAGGSGRPPNGMRFAEVRARMDAVCRDLVVPNYATVLVVEDDPRVRELINVVLRRAGHAIVSVGSPEEALAALVARADIRLLLTDIVMPEMTGYDLAVEARKLLPDLAVVYMSGFASDTIRRLEEAPFVPKPFTVESLTRAVQAALPPRI
jgi:CheY-like chemotaxis protein